MSIAHLALQATLPSISPHQHILWPLTTVMQENSDRKLCPSSQVLLDSLMPFYYNQKGNASTSSRLHHPAHIQIFSCSQPGLFDGLGCDCTCLVVSRVSVPVPESEGWAWRRKEGLQSIVLQSLTLFTQDQWLCLHFQNRKQNTKQQ